MYIRNLVLHIDDGAPVPRKALTKYRVLIQAWACSIDCTYRPVLTWEPVWERAGEGEGGVPCYTGSCFFLGHRSSLPCLTMLSPVCSVLTFFGQLGSCKEAFPGLPCFFLHWLVLASIAVMRSYSVSQCRKLWWFKFKYRFFPNKC